MGSDETAITIPEGPRVFYVFDGNGAPSGPNYLLFSDVDRLADSLWDRSGVEWSPTPHAPVLGAPQRALDPKLWQIMGNRGIAARHRCSSLARGATGPLLPAHAPRPQDVLPDAPRAKNAARIGARERQHHEPPYTHTATKTRGAR
jgi:hypothetical protein